MKFISFLFLSTVFSSLVKNNQTLINQHTVKTVFSVSLACLSYQASDSKILNLWTSLVIFKAILGISMHVLEDLKSETVLNAIKQSVLAIGILISFFALSYSSTALISTFLALFIFLTKLINNF